MDFTVFTLWFTTNVIAASNAASNRGPRVSFAI
jgi:hypothetical protein